MLLYLYSTIAHVHAFTQALIRCGFNQDTANSIWAEGFDDLDVLAQVSADDVESMIKNVRETRRAQGPTAPGVVTFTFMAVRRLKALQHWAKERIRTGRPLQPGLFIGAEMENAVTQLTRETMREAVHEDEDVDKPSELTDLNKWEIFWERFESYMSRLRGAAKCPYTYIFREEAGVTPAMHLVDYQDHDARLVATTILQGDWFTIDNQRVYDEFKNLVVNGHGWSFIKTYDRVKDGRNAILALNRQCEGTSAVQTRKSLAYAKISSARYNGQKRGFTFDTYVQIHQSAHKALAELNEPVPETKKVTDFLAGINDPRLTNAKDLVLADATKLNDFEACQQYFKTLIFNKTTQEKLERQISGVTGDRKKNKNNNQSNGPGPNNNKRSRKGGNNNNTNNNMQVKSYTREEWLALTDVQHAKIKALRAARKAAATSDNRSAASVTASNISSVTQDTYEIQYEPEEPSVATTPPATTAVSVDGPRVRFVPVTKPASKG